MFFYVKVSFPTAADSSRATALEEVVIDPGIAPQAAACI
jgi:hypothetical protein